jgi:hypothetical protein
MNEATQPHEELDIRTGIHAGDDSQVAGGMTMGGGQATAPGGLGMGSGN